MNRTTRLYGTARQPWSRTSTTTVATLTLLLAFNAYSQVPVDENGNPITDDFTPLDNGVQVENPTLEGGHLLSDSELETLVGPIALYPDDLLAIVLPASTYPLEIVQAARFVERAASDSTLKPDEDWDDSVVALLNYPDVLNMMNEDIDWTWKLGEAVVDQQSDVISAIESFRDLAYAAGNLKSDEYQTVSVDDGVIEIEPVNEDVIYVPYYEPTRVVTYAPQPVYHYYPRAYPVYYYPYASDYYFGSRPFWGVTTAFTIGWASDRLHVYHHSYNGHPYYGRRYYGSYWRRPSISVFNHYYVNPYRYRSRNHYYVGDYWRPRYRSGSRPKSRVNRRVYHDRDYYDRYDDGRRDRRSERRHRDQRADRRVNNYGGSNRARSNDRADTIRASGNRARNPGVNNSRNGASRVNRGSDGRDNIRFRQRGNGAYSATRSPRMQRAANDNAVRGAERSRQRATIRRNSDLNRARTSNQRGQQFNTRRQDTNVNRARANDRQARFTGKQNSSRRDRPATRAKRADSFTAPRTNNRATQSRRNNASARNVTPRQIADIRSRQSRGSAASRQQAVRTQASRARNTVNRPNRQAVRSEKRARQSQNRQRNKQSRQSKRSGNESRRSGRSDRKR